MLRDLLDPRLLAFIRDGDLYVAAEDGTRQARIADGGSDDFGSAVWMAWSPDLVYLAAIVDDGPSATIGRGSHRDPLPRTAGVVDG